MAATAYSMSTTLIDGKAPPRQSAAAASSKCVTLPSPPLLHQHNLAWNSTHHCRKLARNVATFAIGEEVASTDVTELIKPLQEKAIDRLPLIPGALELVGIGYTGWFVYKNLVFKPDREALIEKLKSTYNEMTCTGGSI